MFPVLPDLTAQAIGMYLRLTFWVRKRLFPGPSGLPYPALHRLEDRGWLQAEWKESETGREAKFYSLTKKGRRQMDTEILNWERLCTAVGLVLRAPEKES